MAAEIREESPGAEVRLFGSNARGDARPDSDIDLLITVPDDWLAQHNRFEVLDRLRWRLGQPRRPVDLLLFSRSQVEKRQQLHSSVVHQAIALMAIARRDLQAARGMTDATVFHEAVWGFQVQQTIEKALNHDLVALLKLLKEVGIDINHCRDLASHLLVNGVTQQISRTFESISDTDCDDKTRNRVE